MLITSITVMIFALSGLSREQDRPSVQRLMEVLLIAAPIMPAIWKSGMNIAIFAAIYILLTFAFFSSAMVMRQHAPAIGAAVSAVVAFIAVQKLIDVQLEWQLMTAGALLLIASGAISRRLRGNTRGLVTTPSTVTPFDEELQLAATVALAPKIEPSSTSHEPERGEGGGDFGGAGATGKF